MITLGARIKVFLGSFFIQSSWSFSNMQGLGFVAALSPAITELFKGKEDKKREALKRHLAYYNAHPYLASPILGAVIKLEEMALEGRGDELAGRSLKEALMGPYGSIGDGFFWGMLRPVSALIGIVATLFLGFWGPVIFLVVYNLPHLFMRWSGLKIGYARGVGVIEAIGSFDLPGWTRRGSYLGSALLGVIAFLLVTRFFPAGSGLSKEVDLQGFEGWSPILVTIAFIFLALILSEVQARWLGVQRLIILVLVPLFIIAIIFC
jgi:PTS system mannose-specific IID component